MQGHVRKRGASWEYIIDVGAGGGAALPGLRAALLA